MTGAPAPLGHLARRRPRVAHRLASAHSAVYSTTRGRMLSRWFGASILVLETVGRRTGRRRAVPLVYVRDGDDLVVVPADAGSDRPPGWWLNLRAARAGVAVVGHERRPVRPFEAQGAERVRHWARVAEVSPLDDYQRQTGRRFPVVILRRDPMTGRRAAAVRPPDDRVVPSASPSLDRKAAPWRPASASQ